MDLRSNGNYLSVQHYLIVFRNETECVYCTVKFVSNLGKSQVCNILKLKDYRT